MKGFLWRWKSFNLLNVEYMYIIFFFAVLWTTMAIYCSLKNSKILLNIHKFSRFCCDFNICRHQYFIFYEALFHALPNLLSLMGSLCCTTIFYTNLWIFYITYIHPELFLQVSERTSASLSSSRLNAAAFSKHLVKLCI